jgi:hypothetical protein
MLSSSPAALKWPCGYLRCLRHLAPASYFTGLLGSVIGIIGGAVVTETIRSCGKPHLQLPFEQSNTLPQEKYRFRCVLRRGFSLRLLWCRGWHVSMPAPDFDPHWARILDNLLDLLHTLKHRWIIAQWTRIEIFCRGSLADYRWRP